MEAIQQDADSSASLASLRLARLRFRFEALERLRLPPFKGSTLRGALGVALKRTLCLRQGIPDCDGCHLTNACIYPSIFETRLSPLKRRRYPIPTPPFVLIPPQSDRTDFEGGDSFECGLVLVGSAVDQAPSFIRAFAEVGHIGLGAGRGQCRLAEVESCAPVERPPDGRTFALGIAEISAQRIVQDREPWSRAKSWALEFLTPMRLQDRGSLVDEPDFAILIRRLAERLAALMELYGGGTPSDFADILTEASNVRLVESRVRWDDWERYSNRQKTRMRLGGFRGRAVYAGRLSPFVPLLALGEWINVGKGATFGLGRIRVEPLENER